MAMIVKDKLVGVISLGCDKNRVDTEKMLSVISTRHTLTNEIEKAEIIIVNTCAFLESSRMESIDEIMEAYEYKKHGKLEKLIMTGCLPQKYIGNIFEELKEVDIFLGVSDYDRILDAIDISYENKRVNLVGVARGEIGTERVLTTTNYAYLKIADGCSNHCTYCLIPKIRGKYRSVPKEDLIKEAKGLGELNELILVAQDITKYGSDMYADYDLVNLIKDLSLLDNIKGIRLLYCYPESITDELILEIAENPKVIKYIDIPLQHADDRILKLMNRQGTYEGYLSLIARLKERIDGIAIRSTFITGFPGEDQEAFNRLTDFLKEAKLFNAGFFKYSREEGTPAYMLKGQIREIVKEARCRKLYSVQKRIVKKNLSAFIGETIEITAEGFEDEKMCYFGRAYFNAPNIDGLVYFTADREIAVGEKIKIKVLSVKDYDLYGELS